MDVIARGKYIRMSPRKVRLVANLIKGMDVEKAKWQLTFNKKIASIDLLKILNSAIANAKENYDLEAENLKVKTVTVDGGPVLKRWMPRAQGRATPLRKGTSHVVLTLTEIVASGKVKQVKKVDDSDIIKVGTGEFDEIKDIADKKEIKEDAKVKKVAAPKKGFASKVLTRKTGSK
jgi:large subunit ribosomal protein L22